MGVPGCFGMALDHRAIAECRKCPCLKPCRVKARRALELIHQDGNAKSLLRKYRDVSVDDLTEEQMRLLDEMPVKSRELIGNLPFSVFDFERLLQFRENPENGYPDKLRLAINRMRTDGASKYEIRQMYQNSYSVGKKTAESYVSQVFGLLETLSLVTLNQSKYRIKEEYCGTQ